MMSDAVLVILRVPESDEQGVALRRVQGCLDVTSVAKHHSNMNENVVNKAFLYARRSSKRLVALQVLASDLFHWGLNDNILPGPAKMRFVGHIREQLSEQSLETTKMLEQKARQHGVSFEIKKVETDDPASAALEEARGDYDRIFINKEKKKLFPLFKKSMEQQLRKNISVTIVSG
jgi:hypothetical protein